MLNTRLVLLTIDNNNCREKSGWHFSHLKLGSPIHTMYSVRESGQRFQTVATQSYACRCKKQPGTSAFQ